MRTGARRQGITVVVAACLMLSAGVSAGAASSKTALDEWDQSELTLRQAVWTLYAGTVAFGKDMRGRTVDDDLAAWIMTADVRTKLKTARDKAERQQQAGDTDGAYATWYSAKAILDEQSKHLTVIGLYWSQRIPLERLRALWLTSVSRAPDDAAKASRDRINSLANQLAADFAPTDGFNALDKEITQLKTAYDEERQKLAAFSTHEVVAAETRDAPILCVQSGAPGRADGDKQGRSDTAVTHPALLLESPAAEKFYPPDARRDSISGDVILQVTVGADGCMQHAQVATSSGAAVLDDSAMQLVEYASFRPAEVAGQRVGGSLKVKYHFTLDDERSGDSAAVHIGSGNKLLDRGAYDQAIVEFDRAVELEPASAMAIADRGMAYMWKGQYERALADINKAYALDPHNYVVFHGRGILALRTGNPAGAIAAFTDALLQSPGDVFALRWRSEAYVASGDLGHAAHDYAEIIRINPSDINSYSHEALLLRALHKPDEALQQAVAVTAANPGNAAAAVSAGYIYAASGKPDDALHAFDRAIKIANSYEDAYLARARYRPHSDLAGRRADIHTASVVHPDSDRAAVLLADLQSETGDISGAIETLSAELADRPNNVTLLTRRAIMYLKKHQDSLAEADLSEVTEHAKGNAVRLNELCWSLAMADVALERALKTCNEVIAMAPEQPAYLDSLGFVLLKLGRNAEALAAYDHALKRAPLFPMSLYGRGIAKRRQGDSAGGDADVVAATVMDARVADTFAGR